MTLSKAIALFTTMHYFNISPQLLIWKILQLKIFNLAVILKQKEIFIMSFKMDLRCSDKVFIFLISKFNYLQRKNRNNFFNKYFNRKWNISWIILSFLLWTFRWFKDYFWSYNDIRYNYGNFSHHRFNSYCIFCSQN